MISDNRYAFLIGFQTVWAFGGCVERGKPNPTNAPTCALASDLHEIAVKRGLHRDKPNPAAAHSRAAG